MRRRLNGPKRTPSQPSHERSRSILDFGRRSKCEFHARERSAGDRISANAQCGWTECALSQRLKIIRRARLLIVEEAASLTEAANHFRQRPTAEILTSEVVPLAAACRFLEDESGRILRGRRLGWRRRPLWLSGVHSEIQREPHGLILIIAPGNYPLFLPAVQTLQALVARNAVLIKPGDNGSRAAQAFVEILHRAGLPQNLAHVLSEEAIAAQSAIELGIDKVILTGSASTGQAVLAQCAKTLTPTTIELSGCDAVFVRADADLDLVVRALRFGLRLNNGATCIAPRRVFVNRDLVSELETRLRAAIFETSLILDPRRLGCVTDALVAGADFVKGSIQSDGQLLSVPIILSAVASSMRIACEDIFAPVLSLIPVANDAEALAFSLQCPYALGAAIFSRDAAAAHSFAGKVRAGVVVINDLIVPTADPRLPFGGRGRSGFGTTRGAEGLLEMTTPR
ncbi:MAG: aldehyde dehydrogenase family protein [Chthoniobacterales bacterium]|nr:aldehyde dehydrogenase family protein [Chthoniobacterales bacterium]